MSFRNGLKSGLKVRGLAFSFVLLLSSQQIAVSQEVLLADNPTAVKINEYFSALAGLEKFNGNVLVAIDDQVILKKT
ncbi:MAG TPA: hypothetical protein VFZ40_08890, partial [Pyrinomonadaceae bacterium]